MEEDKRRILLIFVVGIIFILIVVILGWWILTRPEFLPLTTSPIQPLQQIVSNNQPILNPPSNVAVINISSSCHKASKKSNRDECDISVSSNTCKAISSYNTASSTTKSGSLDKYSGSEATKIEKDLYDSQISNMISKSRSESNIASYSTEGSYIKTYPSVNETITSISVFGETPYISVSESGGVSVLKHKKGKWEKVASFEEISSITDIIRNDNKEIGVMTISGESYYNGKNSSISESSSINSEKIRTIPEYFIDKSSNLVKRSGEIIAKNVTDFDNKKTQLAYCSGNDVYLLENGNAKKICRSVSGLVAISKKRVYVS
jgi:hypothetical protein